MFFNKVLVPRFRSIYGLENTKYPLYRHLSKTYVSLNEIYMEIYTEEHGDSQLHPKNCYRTLSIAPYKNTF